jgi:hypothetical protein
VPIDKRPRSTSTRSVRRCWASRESYGPIAPTAFNSQNGSTAEWRWPPASFSTSPLGQRTISPECTPVLAVCPSHSGRYLMEPHMNEFDAKLIESSRDDAGQAFSSQHRAVGRRYPLPKWVRPMVLPHVRFGLDVGVIEASRRRWICSCRPASSPIGGCLALAVISLLLFTSFPAPAIVTPAR